MFLAKSIALDLFKWTLLSFKCLSISFVSVSPTNMISRPPLMFISQLFTSCVLSFRLSFRGTINSIVTVFASDFSDSVRSMTDLDTWLAALLLFSSLVRRCNNLWFELNSRLVSLAWSYKQLTLAPLNDLTGIRFLIRNLFVKGSHWSFWQYYRQVWTLYFPQKQTLCFLCYWRVLRDFDCSVD